MSIKKMLLALFVLTISFQTHAQFKNKLIPPSEGKTVIYFLRTSSLGSLMNIRYFDSQQYLGKFNGRSYIRYECDPGEHIFWIKAENVDVLKANLQEGKTYLVETNATMGAFTAAAKFRIIDFKNKRQVKRINKLFDKKKESTFTKEELKKGQEKSRNVIQMNMKKVQKKLKKKKKLAVITPEMYVDLE
jgi:uncharacterized protein YnzC (UPF0291/DUF896 family)